MRRRWPLAYCLAALAVPLLGTGREAEAGKKLEDCPVYQAVTNQRRSNPGSSRTMERYRTTRRSNLSTAGHITNGVKNVILAPLDVPFTMGRVARESNVFSGLVGGTVEGVGNSLDRIVGGTAEVLTAPIPGVRTYTYRRKLGATTTARSISGAVLGNVVDSRQ
ncbi:MAG: hypothetical protein ACODAJ_12620 [Planctomycetota bacterium]